jgi:hypothetical protein
MALTKVKGSGLATGAATASLVGIDDNATSTAITIDASETTELKCQAGDANVGAKIYHPTSTSARHIVKFQSNVGGTQVDKAVIDCAGNVGIGTTTTNQRLNVFGPSAIQVLHNTDATSNNSHAAKVTTFDSGALFWNSLTLDAASISLSTYGVERVAVTNNGLTFNGDTAAANALDDYEEGTWTPSCTVGGIGSYTSATYTKIGRVVTLNLKSATFTNASNNEPLRITGLPFAPSDNTTTGTAMWSRTDVANQWGAVHTLADSSIGFYSTSITGGFDAMRHIDLNSTSAAVYFGATYITNS